MGEQGQRVGEMNKMREAFELWSTDDNPEHWNQRRGFEAGYQAAIADVKAGGVVGFEYPKGRANIAEHPAVPLYKLPEDV